MKKFFVKTLGCKTNQLESAQIAEILEEAGFIETDKIIDADYFILNSCSVTHTADLKGFSLLRSAKAENPDIKTVLTGCTAQLCKEKPIENNTADFIIGNWEKNDIAKILETGGKLCVSDIFSHKDFRYKLLHDPKRTRAFVKIQDGCNNRCSYCTIPFARGISRSAAPEQVIEQIEIFASGGYFETVLTGIHIGQYGLDLKEAENLMTLLEKIEKTSIRRYRLGSLNPLELPYDFIDFLAASKKFCPHFHLSLQSCCDKTLKAMNRNYTPDLIKELVNNINKKFKRPFLGADIIAGFPGETNEDFEITAENLETMALSKIHIFPYSRREGTIADKMKNQVKEEEKKRRCKILQQISDKKLNEFLKSNIGSEAEIIIEKKRDKKTGLLKGISRNYITVLTEGSDSLKDTLQKAVITDFTTEKGRMSAGIIK